MHKKRSFPLRISAVNVVKRDQFPADLVTFTEEILNEILHFLVMTVQQYFANI